VTIRRDNSGADALHAELRALERVTAKVGFFEDAKYPDGTPVAYVAAIQEFGYAGNGIPPRSFMRTTVSDQESNWKALFGKQCAKVANGSITAQDAYETVAALAAGQMRKKIGTITSPPLSPVTLQLRKWARAGIPINRTRVAQAAHLVSLGIADSVSGAAAKPLVFDGILLASVTYEVEQV